MKLRQLLFLAAIAAPFLAVSSARADGPAKPPATLSGEAGRPASAHWLRSELYFAVGQVDDPDESLSEMRWQGFLDREVTPRFPDGLTVLDAYGQWRSRGSETPVRLRSKVLVILYEDTEPNRAAIDAIRVAFKAETHSKSVLLVTEHVDVSF